MDFDVTVFWERVKFLIKQRNLTQRSLSEKLGLTTRTIETWINQKTIPNAYQTYLLSRELDTTVEYLVAGKDPQDKKEVIKEYLESLIQSL